MEYRKLGNTGIAVSNLTLGTMYFGSETSEEEAFALLDAFMEGGRLAAAVSNAGALGLVGGGYGDPDWLRAELSTARSETTRPWGVGLITWHATHETVELVLGYEPHAFMLSFGDPGPFVPAIGVGAF